MINKITMSILLLVLLVINVSAVSVDQTVTVMVVPGKVTFNSPLEGQIFNTRMIPLNLTFTSPADVTYSQKRFFGEECYQGCDEEQAKSLCKDCIEYGQFRNDRTRPFDDGYNTMTLHMKFATGEIDEVVHFIIDFLMPRIIDTFPNENSVVKDNRFYIKYSEENLQNITLFYGNKKIVKTDCESGRNKVCYFDTNISSYDGKTIYYWFEVRDYFNVEKSSKKRIRINLNGNNNCDYSCRLNLLLTNNDLFYFFQDRLNQLMTFLR